MAPIWRDKPKVPDDAGVLKMLTRGLSSRPPRPGSGKRQASPQAYSPRPTGAAPRLSIGCSLGRAFN
jgi:hypothetical protein